MPEFNVNPSRFDPYKNFKFRVRWDGRFVAGISKVGALKRSTEVVEHRVGGDSSTSRKSPGRSSYEAIMLERGVTHDLEFENWANRVWNVEAGLGSEVSLASFQFRSRVTEVSPSNREFSNFQFASSSARSAPSSRSISTSPATCG